MNIYFKNNVTFYQNYFGTEISFFSGSKNYRFLVNKEGFDILLLCDGTKTLKDIVNNTLDKYHNLSNEDIGIITNDTYEFLDGYFKNGILGSKKDSSFVPLNLFGNSNLFVPERLSLELTNQCQLKCKHCFNISGEKRNDEITSEKFIDIMSKFISVGCSSLFLTGGEVFLKKDVDDIIIYGLQNFENVTIATNGYYIADDSIYLLKKFKDKLLIQVSIDGIGYVHNNIRGINDAFEKSLDTIKKLIFSDIKVSIACTVNSFNFDYVEDVVSLAKNIGCSGVTISATTDTGRAKNSSIGGYINGYSDLVSYLFKKYSSDNFFISEEFTEDEITKVYNDIPFPNKCGAGYKNIHVLSDGKVTICPAANNYFIGDMITDDINDLLSYENMKRIINIPTPTKELCKDCVSFDNCGNCIANMLSKTSEECAIINEII